MPSQTTLREHSGIRPSARPWHEDLLFGLIHPRVLTCSATDLSDVLANDLALGSVLPAAWGGPGTTLPQDARLQPPVLINRSGGKLVEIKAEYLELTTFGSASTAGGGYFIELSGSRRKGDHEAAEVVTLVGVTNVGAVPDAALPVKWTSWLDGTDTYANLALCSDVRSDSAAQSGRVLVYVTYTGWTALAGGGFTGIIEIAGTRRGPSPSQNSSGGAVYYYGHREFIGFTGDGDADVLADIATIGTAGFSGMLWRLITPQTTGLVTKYVAEYSTASAP